MRLAKRRKSDINSVCSPQHLDLSAEMVIGDGLKTRKRKVKVVEKYYADEDLLQMLHLQATFFEEMNYQSIWIERLASTTWFDLR